MLGVWIVWGNILSCRNSWNLVQQSLYQFSDRKYKRLFAWLQYNHTVRIMWSLLDASHSEVRQYIVYTLNSVVLACPNPRG
jgi:hypothetical protein